MKKTIQFAFAIALIILSVISTIWSTELIGNIIYAIVLPSFILSFISCVTEISEVCETNANKLTKLANENVKLTQEKIKIEMQSYNRGLHEMPYQEGFVPQKVMDQQEHCFAVSKEALAYAKVDIFFLRCSKICNIINLFGYVLLILSLTLSPYVAQWLSRVNLNCITMWSLALLYVTLELKSTICAWAFDALTKKYLKSIEKNIEEKQ